MSNEAASGQATSTSALRCVLQLMAEGGSLAVLATSSHPQKFCFWLEDVSLELIEEGPAVNTRSPWGTFEQAIERLETYPWRKLYPRYIAPEFLDRILAEVKRGSGPLSEAIMARWEDAAEAVRANEQRVPCGLEATLPHR